MAGAVTMVTSVFFLNAIAVPKSKRLKILKIAIFVIHAEKLTVYYEDICIPDVP